MRRHRAAVVLILAFGVLYALTLDGHGMFVWDEAEYANYGRSVLRGEGLATGGRPMVHRLPVLPLSLAASMWLFRGTEDWMLRLSSFGWSLVALLVVYVGVETIHGRRPGLMAAAFLGLFPAFWQATPLVLTEIPFMASFTAAVLLFSMGLRRSARFFWASWACAGISMLTRYTAVLFAPIVVLLLLVPPSWREPAVRRRLLSRDFLLSPLLGLFIVLPWLVRQHLVTADALWGFKAAAVQLQSVPGEAVTAPWYAYLAALPSMVAWAPAALIVLGAFHSLRARSRVGLHCLLAMAVILAWFSGYDVKTPRLVTPALPFAAVLAAVGFRRLVAACRHAWLPMAILTLGSTLAVSTALTLPTLRGSVALGYPSLLHALRFLRERTPPGARIAGATRPQAEWYADRVAVGLPAAERDFPRLLETVDWVVVTSFERGQPAYASGLGGRLQRADFEDGGAMVFRDPRFVTIVISARRLRERW